MRSLAAGNACHTPAISSRGRALDRRLQSRSRERMPDYTRRALLKGALAGAASAALPSFGRDDLGPVYDRIRKRHDEAVQRIQHWIRQPTIAAENVGSEEGLRLMIELLRDAGFERADRIGTDGKPGVFATLDAGAPRTFGLYFMYDVKQVDPAEWSSPPWE